MIQLSNIVVKFYQLNPIWLHRLTSAKIAEKFLMQKKLQAHVFTLDKSEKQYEICEVVCIGKKRIIHY